MDAKVFGKFIMERRKQLGMTQAELAEKINVTDKAVSRWERGLGFPDINTLEPLADAFGIEVLNHVWDDRLYWWPVPQSEMSKSGALIQNPGY